MRRPSNGFGLVLVLVGTLLLMNNLGYIRLHWGQVWPAFPLVFGLSLFLQFLHDWDRGILVPATLFSGAGIFFYYLVNSPTGFNWGLWPSGGLSFPFCWELVLSWVTWQIPGIPAF